MLLTASKTAPCTIASIRVWRVGAICAAASVLVDSRAIVFHSRTTSPDIKVRDSNGSIEAIDGCRDNSHCVRIPCSLGRSARLKAQRLRGAVNESSPHRSGPNVNHEDLGLQSPAHSPLLLDVQLAGVG